MTGQGGDEFLFTREDYLLDLMRGLSPNPPKEGVGLAS